MDELTDRLYMRAAVAREVARLSRERGDADMADVEAYARGAGAQFS